MACDKEIAYLPLHSPTPANALEDSKIPLMSEDVGSIEPNIVRKWNISSTLIVTLANVLILLMSVVFCIKGIAAKSDDATCAGQLSTYSPAISAIGFQQYTFSNGFDEPDEYRGPPNPERDAAWLALWQMGDIVVKDADLAKINKTDEATRRISRPELGGVAANLEVFHQLHCLDLLRRFTYKDSYAPEDLPKDFQGRSTENIREHVDHCIKTLRIAITCTSDVTPILLERGIEDPQSITGDFYTLHKCRDFKKLQEWYKENSYTDWDCIQRGGVKCDIIPAKYKTPQNKDRTG